jgi:hypothetical protein
MKKQIHCLAESDIEKIVNLTDGYSGSDMDGLIREAALGKQSNVLYDVLILTVGIRSYSRNYGYYKYFCGRCEAHFCWLVLFYIFYILCQ